MADVVMGMLSRGEKVIMKTFWRISCSVLLLAAPLLAQGKRLWVLRSPGQMVEYDAVTFSAKQTVKVPAEAVQSPQSISINRLGQILFSPAVQLPLSEEDALAPHKLWFWNGHVATTIDLGVKRDTASTGSNQAVTEMAPAACLSADGAHLYWFANQLRRLQREELDLSVTTTWQAWRTDLSGGGREDLATSKLPECACPSGTCEESCPDGEAWVPDGGVDKVFLMNQVTAGKTGPVYKASTRYQYDGAKWVANPQTEALQRVLDVGSDGNVVVEAIPDTSCCGWSNQSDDQTLVLNSSKKITLFDELATYKNLDYDVSFYTSNAHLSPDFASVAMTIVATAQTNKPIQISEQGQASAEESRQIHRALADLPAVEVKSVEAAPRRIAFAPHAVLIGWLSEKELLIVEDHVLVAYNVATGAQRKSSVHVDDAARVFLR